MTSKPLAITTIDCARDHAEDLIAALRDKLSPRGDIVSEAGRRRTIELFGEALSPQQVVERICRDVPHPRPGGRFGLWEEARQEGIGL